MTRVAFDGDEEVGFVLAHDLPRRHGSARQFFVYEIDVLESHRRPANGLYESIGGTRSEAVLWGFELGD